MAGTAAPTTDVAAVAAATPVYDETKFYSVTLARVVMFEGFTLKPGPTPVEMSGAWANRHASDIARAVELPPAAPQPVASAGIHETAKK
jgi:hypothetical protein